MNVAFAVQADNVESAGWNRPLPLQIMLRCKLQPALFPAVDTVDATAEAGVTPLPYFDENQCLPIPHDQIDLTMWRPVIPFVEDKAMRAQMTLGHALRCFTAAHRYPV